MGPCNTKHVVDLNFQFPETSKHTADLKITLVRELRTRLAALSGVAAITSARAPEDIPIPTAAISLDGEKSSAHNVQSILYYTYVEANYFQTLNILAIGAQRRAILGLILRESARPVVAGLLVGMVLAVGDSFLLRRLLFGVNTIDGISFVSVPLLLLAIALLAAYPPSRRAMRVDPVVALRYE